MRSRLRASLLASLLLVLPAHPARADQAATFRAAAHGWFEGERSSGYLWGGVGLASLAAAGALHRAGHGSDLERGMAYPIGAVGLLQTAIGIGSLARGRGRDDAFDASLAASPEATRQSEIARMNTLQTAFVVIEVLEAALVVGGVTFAATRTQESQQFARGVGLGIAAQGGLMLLLDALAASRAHTYAGQLDALSFTSSSSATMLSWRSSF